MKKLTLVLTTLTLVFAGATASATNLLVNAGFEDPIDFSGPPDFTDNWEGFAQGFGETVFASTNLPRSGAQSLELGIFGIPNTFAGVLQDVTGLSAGQEATFSGFAFSGLQPGGIEIRIEWRDSVNDIEIARTANLSPTIGAAYEAFSLTDIVPVGADTARVVFAIQSFGGANDQSVFVDDTSFSIAKVVVSEPGILALFGLSALILAGVRRRTRQAG